MTFESVLSVCGMLNICSMKNNTFMAVGNVCKKLSLKAMLLIVALLCGLGGAVAQTQSSDSVYYV